MYKRQIPEFAVRQTPPKTPPAVGKAATYAVVLEIALIEPIPKLVLLPPRLITPVVQVDPPSVDLDHCRK